MNRRVCMVVKNQLWNDARVKKEALALSGAGWSVTILAFPEDGAPERETWNGIEVVRVPRSGRLRASVRKVLDTGAARPGFWSRLRRHPLKKSVGNLFHSVLYQRRLLALALKTGADVFHAHDLDALAVCAAAAWLRRARLVYDSHELWLHSTRHLEGTDRLFMFLERLAEKTLAPRADAVIAVTPGRARKMERMYPSVSPVVVANYPPEAAPEPSDPTLRKALGAGEGDFLFLYQGVICPHRGLEQLADASAMLEGSPATVAVLGHDAGGGALRAYAGKLGPGARIVFHPPVKSEELHRYTASADAGLVLLQGSCLNHILSLPNKLFEYMMAGIPVLACDLPEIARVIRKHGCGFIVDPADPEAVARAMRDMAADPGEARRMGERGRAAALSHYTWDVSARGLLYLYSRLDRGRKERRK